MVFNNSLVKKMEYREVQDTILRRDQQCDLLLIVAPY